MMFNITDIVVNLHTMCVFLYYFFILIKQTQCLRILANVCVNLASRISPRSCHSINHDHSGCISNACACGRALSPWLILGFILVLVFSFGFMVVLISALEAAVLVVEFQFGLRCSFEIDACKFVPDGRTNPGYRNTMRPPGRRMCRAIDSSGWSNRCT